MSTHQQPLKLFTSKLEVINIGLEVFYEDLGITPLDANSWMVVPPARDFLIFMRLQNADTYCVEVGTM